MSQYYSQTFLSGQLLKTQEQNLLTDVADDHVSDDWWTTDDNDNPEAMNNENSAPIRANLQGQQHYIPLDVTHETEIGQNTMEWNLVMKKFASRKMYNDRLNDFIEYATGNPSELTLDQKLIRYFDLRSEQRNDDGTEKYRATNWLSVFVKFWKFVRFQDLKQLAPIIETKISDLEKIQEEAKQAKVFEIKDLVRYLEMTHTPETLVDKAFLVIGLSFGARGKEITLMAFENISRKKNDVTVEMNIIVEFNRSKTSGVPQKSTALISGAIEIKILTEYENCFSKDSEKKGRYFRKMKL